MEKISLPKSVKAFEKWGFGDLTEISPDITTTIEKIEELTDLLAAQSSDVLELAARQGALVCVQSLAENAFLFQREVGVIELSAFEGEDDVTLSFKLHEDVFDLHELEVSDFKTWPEYLRGIADGLEKLER